MHDEQKDDHRLKAWYQWLPKKGPHATGGADPPWNRRLMLENLLQVKAKKTVGGGRSTKCKKSSSLQEIAVVIFR
jgi:hypothetical protein